MQPLLSEGDVSVGASAPGDVEASEAAGQEDGRYKESRAGAQDRNPEAQSGQEGRQEEVGQEVTAGRGGGR